MSTHTHTHTHTHLFGCVGVVHEKASNFDIFDFRLVAQSLKIDDGFVDLSHEPIQVLVGVVDDRFRLGVGAGGRSLRRRRAGGHHVALERFLDLLPQDVHLVRACFGGHHDIV